MQRRAESKRAPGGLREAAAGCLLVGVALSVSGCSIIDAWRDQWWKSDPELAAQAARGMIDYDLPPAYQEFMVLEADGDTDAVVIGNSGQPADIILVQLLPDGILGTVYQTEVEERWSREIAGHHYDTQTAGTLALTVRDQSTTLRILEGTDEEGRLIRQAVCMFAGKRGDVFLVLVATQDTWDQALVEGFLESIR